MNIEYSFWTTVSDRSPMKVLFELVRSRRDPATNRGDAERLVLATRFRPSELRAHLYI